MACVEGVGDSLRVENSNGSRKGAIEGAQKICGRDRGLKGKAGDLGESMYAGIGAAGALRQGRLTDDAGESTLKFALDGGFARLHLPAVEIRAVVGNGKSPSVLWKHGLSDFGHEYQCR